MVSTVEKMIHHRILVEVDGEYVDSRWNHVPELSKFFDSNFVMRLVELESYHVEEIFLLRYDDFFFFQANQ